MSANDMIAQRIAIVSDSIAPYNQGGKETRIFELATRLATEGHDVHIYTMHWWPEKAKSRMENGVHLHAISRLYPLYAGDRRSITQGILFGLACFKLIMVKFDVIDVDHMPYFPLFAVRLVTLLKRKPMTATWHEVWGKDYWRQYLGRLGPIAYAIELLSTRLPSKIIAVSDMTNDRLRNDLRIARPSFIVRNGIDIAQINQIAPHAAKSDIIYAGRLIEHKNVDVLLRAVALLKSTHPDITCAIFGDGPERANLEKLSRKLGISKNVSFNGFLDDHSDVFAHMKSSKVFVLPSTREGFGISVIEANICGIPVVTINCATNAAKDLITPVTGRLARLDPFDLALQVSTLLAQSPSKKSIRSAVSSYDWGNAALALTGVYAQ